MRGVSACHRSLARRLWPVALGLGDGAIGLVSVVARCLAHGRR